MAGARKEAQLGNWITWTNQTGVCLCLYAPPWRQRRKITFLIANVRCMLYSRPDPYTLSRHTVKGERWAPLLVCEKSDCGICKDTIPSKTVFLCELSWHPASSKAFSYNIWCLLHIEQWLFNLKSATISGPKSSLSPGLIMGSRQQ